MQYKQLAFKSFLSFSLSFLSVTASFAGSVMHVPHSFASPVKQPNYWVPRFTGWGFGDLTNSEGLLKGDLMFPFYTGGSKMPFIDIQGKGYTDDSWMGGVGLGYRQLDYTHDRIWGGYLFGDYSSIKSHKFWVLNPGIENLGKTWDFRGNVYIPLSSKKWIEEKYFDTSGDYVSFTGHEQYNRLYTPYREIGYGVDGEIGYHIPKAKGLAAYLGGYSGPPHEIRSI